MAHRGDSAHAPENTLEAARLGRSNGADAWELDVQLTRDGIPVVLHDESLLRTTDLASRFAGDPRVEQGGYLADFDFAEIQTLDAGSWFFEGSNGARIPTLREALELTIELDWLVNVELKSFPEHDPRLLDVVFAELDATGAANRVLISSFDHDDVAQAAIRGGGGGVATGALIASPLRSPDRYVREIVGADCLHVSTEVLGAHSSAYRNRPGVSSLRGNVVRALKDQGIPVLVYTVPPLAPGGVSLAEDLAHLGETGLFCDDPGGVRSEVGAVVLGSGKYSPLRVPMLRAMHDPQPTGNTEIRWVRL